MGVWLVTVNVVLLLILSPLPPEEPFFFSSFLAREAAAAENMELVAARAAIAKTENFMVVVVGYTYVYE